MHSPSPAIRVNFNSSKFPLLQARAAARGLTPADYLEALFDEDNQRNPLPASAVLPQASTLDPDECLRLSLWFKSVGGDPLFAQEVYANPETSKYPSLDGFITYLSNSSRTRFRKNRMSTNEKTGWRLKYIEARYLQAQAAGTLNDSQLLNELRTWAQEAKQNHP